uniref:Photosystem II protein J n=1 Tax=Neogoniolithon spectabile TaxID=231755 RepID=A0A3G3MH22_9FLOR|nr:photosystem II protein J [Neogoniolithon spectabile]AYR06130.1 photosystem II protein J [Neogoniolithon spectabile]
MVGTGRVPLWLVATLGGIAVIVVLGIFYIWFLFRYRFFFIKILPAF